MTGKGANEKIDREAHVKRIKAFQVAQGELPYPLLAPIPQPGYVFATRLVFDNAPQPTGNATAAPSTEVPEEAAHLITPPTDQEFRNECAAYRRHQDMFAADLCKIIVRPERRTEFQSLLGRSGRKLRPYNYEQAARLAHRDKPTPQPSPEGAPQTSGAATADGQLPLPLFSAIPTTQPPFEAAIQLVRDGIAAVVLEEEGSRAPQQSGHATADGQLPLPLFSTMLTTQPPSERATRLTGRANAASLSLSSSSSSSSSSSDSDSEAKEETEDSVVDSSIHELNAPLDRRTSRRLTRYHRFQRVFMEEFLFTTVAKCDELEFWKLFATGPHQPGGKDETPVTIQRADTYVKAAKIVSRNPDFHPDRRLLQHLRRTIRCREKAQRWFDRMHPGDARRKHQNGHRWFIKLLKRVYQALSGGRAYSPTRH